MRSPTLFFFAAALLALPLAAYGQPKPIKIWPHLAPGSESAKSQETWKGKSSVRHVYQPDLTVFPSKRTSPGGASAAAIVFPGGGYRQVVMKKEGYKVAQWLSESGVTAFVLKYRLDRSAALRDAQRAVSFVRERAKRFGINKNKIGVIGFSAGAHLAANLALNHAARPAADATDKVSSRPDFWVGVYGRYGHLYGKPGKLSRSAKLPPAFLVHAANDSKVPVAESLQLYMALQESGVPAELHVFERGEHGFALETNRGPHIASTVNAWSGRCLAWLKVRGIL